MHTRGQHYKKITSVFTSMASILSELPATRFGACMQWLQQMENSVRDGSWESAAGMTDEANSAVDDADDVDFFC